MNTQRYAGYISPVVLAIVVGMYGYWAVQRDLVSSRPATPGALDVPDPFPIPGVNTFHSRMWEDPLAPSYAHWKGLPESERELQPDLVQGGGPLNRRTVDGADESETPQSLEIRAQQMRQLLRGIVDASEGTVDQDKHTLCLPVFLPGAPYAEDRERRTRIRYSVVTALAEARYHLEYNRRMSYAVAKVWIKTHGGWHEREIVVPIKLYKHDSQDRQVLVLWVNESELGLAPLLSTHRILHALFRDVSQPDRFTLSIIGPASSGTLERMSEELASLRGAAREYSPDERQLFDSQSFGDQFDQLSDENKHWFISSYHADESSTIDQGDEGPTTSIDVTLMRGFLPLLSTAHVDTDADVDLNDRRTIIFSPRATKDFREDYQDEPGENLLAFVAGDSDGSDSSDTSALELIRVIGTDYDLARSLLEELHVRGATERIVLITEHDTAYGRAIPDAFEMARQSVNDRIRESGGVTFPDDVFTVFSVLRGIDGNVPGDDGSAQDSQRRREAAGQTSISDLPDVVERPPEGRSQYDYLRRLLLRIEELGHVAAIGVVGSDVYDKLLMLRALKPHCPDSVFFTTDLDTIYAHPNERPHTRNLLIASHFGLSLDEPLQRETPPFRDSYQSATFLATRLALDHDDHRSGADDSGSQIYSESAVYVVGEKQMHLLSRAYSAGESDESGHDHGHPANVADSNDPVHRLVHENLQDGPGGDVTPSEVTLRGLFHPDIVHGRSAWHYLTPLALVLLAGILAWSWFHREDFGAVWLWAELRVTRVNLCLSLLVGLGAVLCLFFLGRGMFGNESADLFDAYSTWPTKVLYSITGMVSLMSVIYLTGKFRNRTGEPLEGSRSGWPVFGERQQIKILLLSLVFTFFLIVCISPHPHTVLHSHDHDVRLVGIEWEHVGLCLLWIAALCIPVCGLGVARRLYRNAESRDQSAAAGNLVLGDGLAAALRYTMYALSVLVVVCVLGGLGEAVVAKSDIGWHPVPATRGLESRMGDWIAMVYAFGGVATLVAAFVYLQFWCREFGNWAARHGDALQDGHGNAELPGDLEDETVGRGIMDAQFREGMGSQPPEADDVAELKARTRKWESDCARLEVVGNLTAITGRLAPLLMALLLVLVVGYHPLLSPVQMPASLLVLTTLGGVVFVASALSLRRHFARDREDVQSRFDLDLLKLQDRLDTISAAQVSERDRELRQRESGREPDESQPVEPVEPGAEAAQPLPRATPQTAESQQNDPMQGSRRREQRRLKALVPILQRRKTHVAGLSVGVFRSWNESPLGWILGGGTMLALVDLWVRWWSIGI